MLARLAISTCTNGVGLVCLIDRYHAVIAVKAVDAYRSEEARRTGADTRRVRWADLGWAGLGSLAVAFRLPTLPSFGWFPSFGWGFVVPRPELSRTAYSSTAEKLVIAVTHE